MHLKKVSRDSQRPRPRECAEKLLCDNSSMSSNLLDKESEDLILAVIKNDCPTCQLLIPTLENLGKAGKLTVVLQDEMDFPYEDDWVVDDRELEISWSLNLDSVPTLLRFEKGEEVERTVGWSREEWRKITGDSTLGDDLPEFKPG